MKKDETTKINQSLRVKTDIKAGPIVKDDDDGPHQPQ